MSSVPNMSANVGVDFVSLRFANVVLTHSRSLDVNGRTVLSILG